MGIIRRARRLIRLGIFAFCVMTGAMLAWTFLWPDLDVADMAPADVIVCLGGGMAPDGTLAPSVLTRIDRCVDLYDADIAPVVVFTGGPTGVGGPAAGNQMMRYAATKGIPDNDMIAENRAQSTLQNALFSLALVPDAQDFVIVTEGFHLPRAWASFHWARWQSGAPNAQTFRAVMSEPVRVDRATGRPRWQILARESVAIWFNIARAVAYSGVPNADIDWLR